MNTVTIPKIEYRKLKERSSAYLKIVKYITGAERDFTYDYKYIKDLTREARDIYKKGGTIEAGSVNEALKKFRQK
jgi:hypothetical protein